MRILFSLWRVMTMKSSYYMHFILAILTTLVMRPALAVTDPVPITADQALDAATTEELTPEYLSGSWCKVLTIINGVEQPNKRDWEFRKDGHLYINLTRLSTEMSKNGAWSVENGKLSFKPTEEYGEPKVVVIKSKDSLVLHWLGEIHLQRGVCKK